MFLHTPHYKNIGKKINTTFPYNRTHQVRFINLERHVTKRFVYTTHGNLKTKSASQTVFKSLYKFISPENRVTEIFVAQVFTKNQRDIQQMVGVVIKKNTNLTLFLNKERHILMKNLENGNQTKNINKTFIQKSIKLIHDE